MANQNSTANANQNSTANGKSQMCKLICYHNFADFTKPFHHINDPNCGK